MRPIIAAVLLLDVAVLLGVIFVVVRGKYSPDRPKLPWRAFVVALFLAGWVSRKLGARYATGPGVELTRDLGFILIGMSLLSLLIALRNWRRMDSQR